MSDSPVHITPMGDGSDDDLLAAEYVLGTLAHDERVAAEARVKDDPGFAARVEQWEGRFAPLNIAYEDEPAPDLLEKIESRIFGTPARVQQSNLWRMAWALAGGALAAMALIILVMSQTDGFNAPADRYAATLDARGTRLIFAAAWNPETKELQVQRTVGQPAGTGHDYELWLIGKDGVPISLGLLRGETTKVAVPALKSGVVLAVSLEPMGGSPTGKPTGPVLVQGDITKL